MPEGELEVSIGKMSFKAKGDQDWISGQLKAFWDVAFKNGGKELIATMASSDGSAGRDAENPPMVATSLGIGPKATAWLRREGISEEQLVNVFHFDSGGVEVIANSLPSLSLREKTRDAYLLSGIVGFLQQDEPSFTDEVARENCRKLGCYDRKHHASYLNDVSNLFTGSGDVLKLTAPGLAGAVRLIKGMTGNR